MFRAIQLVVLLLLLAVRLVAVAAQGTFTTIDFPEATSTNITGINPRGDIVGQYTSADGVDHGFLLSGGQFTTIDVPNATFTDARGINPRGDIVGRYISAGVNHGYVLRDGEFTTIDVPGATATGATEITPGGDIVGGYISADGVGHGFLLSKDQ
jgi:uncharacterized membrane protein